MSIDAYNYYEILGVPMDASKSDIIFSIKKISKILANSSTLNIDEVKWRRLLNYIEEILTDDKKREKYNQALLEKKNNSVNYLKQKSITQQKIVIKDLIHISKYCEEITDKIYGANPAISREKEIEQLQLSLLTLDKSAVIVGEAGVGKTAIAEGLAYLISEDKVPKLIRGIRIFKLNISSLVAGKCYRGDFEQRLIDLFEELKKFTSVILFIDEIHTIISFPTSTNFSNIAKPYLDKGNIKIIGTTTEKEYQKYILSDEALKRRFEKISVLEPSKPMCVSILLGTISKLENEFQIKYDIDIITTFKLMGYIANITDKQFRTKEDNQNNPDLALTILNKAFANAELKEKGCVRVEDFVASIMNCERLSPEFRNIFAVEVFDNWYISPRQPQNMPSKSNFNYFL